MITIAVVNNKGGVAKTTTAGSLAAAIAQQGHRVLAADLDGQANLSGWMGAGKNTRQHVGELLLASPEQAAKWPTRPVVPNLELLPSNQMLSESLEKLAKQKDAQPRRRLRTRLAQLAARYDFCVLDTPPDIEGLTMQALHAADCYVVVTEPETFAVEGLAKMMQRAQGVQAGQKEPLRFMGFIIPKFNDRIRGKLRKAMLKSITDNFGEDSILGAIRYGAVVSECQGLRETLYQYAPESNPALDYLTATTNLLNRL